MTLDTTPNSAPTAARSAYAAPVLLDLGEVHERTACPDPSIDPVGSDSGTISDPNGSFPWPWC